MCNYILPKCRNYYKLDLNSCLISLKFVTIFFLKCRNYYKLDLNSCLISLKFVTIFFLSVEIIIN